MYLYIYMYHAASSGGNQLAGLASASMLAAILAWGPEAEHDLIHACVYIYIYVYYAMLCAILERRGDPGTGGRG
jgi:hypothetical protein